jgi:hypothetical protein
MERGLHRVPKRCRQESFENTHTPNIYIQVIIKIEGDDRRSDHSPNKIKMLSIFNEID